MITRVRLSIASLAFSVCLLAALLAARAGEPRREEDDWSQPDRGLAWRIETDKPQYAEGEPVVVRLHFKNVGGQPIVIEEPTVPAGALSPLRVYVAVLLPGREDISIKCPAPRKPSFATLRPDETRGFSFSLGPKSDPPCTFLDRSEFFPIEESAFLRAGVYQLQAQYFGRRYGPSKEVAEANRLLDENRAWLGSLTSAPMKFSIVPSPDMGNVGWPASLEGLQLALQLDKERAKVGESVRLTRKVANVSDAVRSIYPFHYLNGDLRVHWVNLATGQRARFGDGKDGGHQPLTLQPKDTLSEDLVDSVFTKKAGKYCVFISCRIPRAAKRVFSNVVRLEILPEK